MKATSFAGFPPSSVPIVLQKLSHKWYLIFCEFQLSLHIFLGSLLLRWEASSVTIAGFLLVYVLNPPDDFIYTPLPLMFVPRNAHRSRTLSSSSEYSAPEYTWPSRPLCLLLGFRKNTHQPAVLCSRQYQFIITHGRRAIHNVDHPPDLQVWELYDQHLAV